MESPRSPRSPEAEIGYRVEDLWDIQEPQLSPSEKLNSCFEKIPVSSFPLAHPSQVVEIPSDSSLADTVETLSKHKILSAPVRKVEAPDDASWIDRYIGIVEFAGIAVWLLHQVTPSKKKLFLHACTSGVDQSGYNTSAFAHFLSIVHLKQVQPVGTTLHWTFFNQVEDIIISWPFNFYQGFVM
ncbi:uncharacterized protein A4U43_C09F13380 [Asparagus officinalis]|uniref:CBS domain-containing protein n=1 Tax=Asparagus officinalis TaxID=4686 RepID=A0A5P1E7D6_ASPOF|nr:uncharacterized protein A4U43_C09F13380 [Asparagus officinalis]